MAISNFTINEETKEVTFTYEGSEYTLGCQVDNGIESPLTETQAEERIIKRLNSPAPLTESEINLLNLRKARNAKLAETDWTQSRDVTLTNDAAWATYRQALRDITDTYSSLDTVVWPTKPE